MVRAGNSRGEPKFFGRRHFFKEDLMHVKEIMEKSSKSEYPNEFRAMIYYQLGEAFRLEKNESQSESYFKKAIKTDPNSMWAEKAKDEL
jgi:hypothetical protein